MDLPDVGTLNSLDLLDLAVPGFLVLFPFLSFFFSHFGSIRKIRHVFLDSSTEQNEIIGK